MIWVPDAAGIASALLSPNCHSWFLLVPLVPSHGTASVQILRDLCLPHLLLHLHRAGSRVTEVSACGSPLGLTAAVPSHSHLHLGA